MDRKTAAQEKEQRDWWTGFLLVAALPCISFVIFAGILGSSAFNNPVTNTVYIAPDVIPVMIGLGTPGNVGSLYYYNCSATSITLLVLPTYNASSGGHNLTAAIPSGLIGYTGPAWPADIMQPIYYEKKVVVNGTLTNCEIYANRGVGFKVPLFWLFVSLAGLKLLEGILFSSKGVQRKSNLFNNLTMYAGVNPLEVLGCLGAYAVLYMVMVTEIGVVTDIQLSMFILGILFPQCMSYMLRVAVHSFMDEDNGPSWGRSKKAGTMLLSQMVLFVAIMWVFWAGEVILVITVVSDFAGVFYQNLVSFSTYTDSPSLIIAAWVNTTVIVQFGVQTYYHMRILARCFDKSPDAKSQGDMVTPDGARWNDEWLHALVVWNSLTLWALLSVACAICLASTYTLSTVAATF